MNLSDFTLVGTSYPGMTLIDRLLSFDYISEFVPIFIVLIVIDVVIDIVKKRHQYQFGDTLANLSTGSLTTIGANITKGLTFLVYIYIYNHCALIDMTHLSTPMKWVAGFILLLLVDCLYYWFHRFAHRVNIGWVGHAVHHQSEEYNLSVALRQGIFQPQYSWLFFQPLAIVGFPVLWLISMHGLMIVYQFWIHTESVKNLGPLEYVLNTPSHHRVHHGVNKIYQDRNYAGMFIFWDKLFGTFAPEDKRAVYGTTSQLKSWNPITANLQHVYAVLEVSKKIKSPWQKFLIWFRPPEWRPPQEAPCVFPTDAELDVREKYKTRSLPWKIALAGVTFSFGVLASMKSIDLGKNTPTMMAIILGIVAFLAYLSASLIIERRPIR